MREAVGTRRKTTIPYPGVLTNDKAKQIAEKGLYSQWTQRQGFEFTTPMNHLLIAPGDVGTVTENGEVHRVEIGAIDIQAGGALAFKAAREDAEIFISTATGASGGAVPGEILVTGTSFWTLLDIPLLRDQDEGLIYYAAAGPFGDNLWLGLTILDSADGVNFAPAFTSVPGDGAISHGTADGTFGAPASPYKLDTANSLKVWMARGTLSSITYEALLEEAQNGIIFESGEIAQFQDAVLQPDGSYLLSNFVRGLRGTENYMDQHFVDEMVLFPTAKNLFRKEYGSERLNVERLYKGVTAGDPVVLGSVQSFTATGRSKAPYPVREESFTASIANDDWTITFQARPRYGNVSVSFSDMPFVENTADFEADIYDGSTIVRTITPVLVDNSQITTSTGLEKQEQSIFYDSADQITDFGSVQTTLTLEVFQIGEHGRGEGSGQITVTG